MWITMAAEETGPKRQPKYLKGKTPLLRGVAGLSGRSFLLRRGEKARLPSNRGSVQGGRNLEKGINEWEEGGRGY